MTEDNDEKDYVQKDEPQKALPAPEEKKREMLRFDIDLEELFTKIPPHITPANQAVWKCREEMSKDYLELNRNLQVLGMYIARCCNEGPEVSENINKRIILASTVFRMIIDNLAITGYDAYGMLIELQQDLFMKVDGRRHILNTLAQVEQEKEKMAQEQADSYTS